jgi:hypothetical protein
MKQLIFTILLVTSSCFAASFDLTVQNTGLAIGDVPNVNGIRLNWSDSYFDCINGVNLTFWKPDENIEHGQIVASLLACSARPTRPGRFACSKHKGKFHNDSGILFVFPCIQLC